MHCTANSVRQTIVERYPLLRIDPLNAATRYTTLYLSWVYWQIKTVPQSVVQSGFFTSDSYYERSRMAFSLSATVELFLNVYNEYEHRSGLEYRRIRLPQRCSGTDQNGRYLYSLHGTQANGSVP